MYILETINITERPSGQPYNATFEVEYDSDQSAEEFLNFYNNQFGEPMYPPLSEGSPNARITSVVYRVSPIQTLGFNLIEVG